MTASTRTFLLVVSLLVAAFATAAAQTVDKEMLAQRIVQHSAGVKEGDLVVIGGSVRDLELLENIAANVRKVGAFPLLTVTSDRLIRKMYTDVPAKYDSSIDGWDALLAGSADVFIGLDVNEDEGVLAGIPPERIARRARAASSAGDMTRARGVRQINLGNGMYPTSNLARRFGVSEADLTRMFWSGVNVDSSTLTDAGNRFRRALAGGREMQITNPNGTNLRVRIDGRPILVSDGTISPEAMAHGEKTSVWLPAGEVFFTPVAGTAEGKIVVPRYYFQGKPIENLVMTVKGGRVVNLTAASGIEPLRAAWNAAPEGRDLLSVIDFGINPNVTVPAGSRMDAWVPAGMVTLSVGNDTWAGGENNVGFGVSAFLPGSTVTVDGKAIVENGAARF
ncbi:MAG: aminopeptidase [Thermoanaerobaculia bacterium]